MGGYLTMDLSENIVLFIHEHIAHIKNR